MIFYFVVFPNLFFITLKVRLNYPLTDTNPYCDTKPADPSSATRVHAFSRSLDLTFQQVCLFVGGKLREVHSCFTCSKLNCSVKGN